MTIKFKYTGAGEFYGGVPARDLTDADWADLDEARRELVLSGRLYEGAETRGRGDAAIETKTVSSKGAKKGRSKKESA